MKINCAFTARVLSSKKIVNSNNGKEYFQLTLFDENSGEAGQIFATEDVYSSIIPGRTYDIGAVYDDKYNSFKIAGVKDVEE